MYFLKMTLYFIFIFFYPFLIMADLPHPRFLILGQTGVGKSTLANVLIGEDVHCSTCPFPICNWLNSCTKGSKYTSSQWPDCNALSECLNELVGSTTKNISAWNIDVSHGQWLHPDPNPDVPDDEIWSSCGQGKKWYGWELNEKIGSISTIFPVSGKVKISFGNCWNSGDVAVYLNGVLKSSAIPNSHHKSTFLFEAGDELVLQDEGPNSIIQIENIELTQCAKDMRSCTKKTKYASGQWLGKGSMFTVIDTPGFGNSEGQEMKYVDEMLEILETTIKETNAVILLLNAEEERLDYAFEQTIRQMAAMFGNSFWDFTIIGVSHWAFDANSIAERNRTGKNEDWYLTKWNKEFKEKFHLEKDLSGVFIDAWSQQPWNREDPGQQDAFQKETAKLLGFAEQNGLFPFKTIDDVLEENQKLKEENKWMNDVITHNISEIMKQMDDIRDQHAEDITELGKDISSIRTELTEDITDLVEDISSVRTELTEDITELVDDISSVRTELTEGITILTQQTSANISAAKAELADDISSVGTELTEDITILAQHTSANISVVKTELEENIDSARTSLNVFISSVKSELERDISSVRTEHVGLEKKHEEDIENIRNELISFNQSDIIGTISAWTPYPDKTNPQPISLPKCYVLCDGSEITEGIWAGHKTPNLNKSKRFLRGGRLSDVLKVEEDSLQEHSHTSTISDPGHTHGYTNWGGNGGADGTPDPKANLFGDVFYFNYPYHFQSDSAKSGISMSVTGVRGARKSSETKPKNMNVVFVMKVC